MRFHLPPMPNKKIQSGLTISELVVAITLSSLIMLALVPLLMHMASAGNTYARTGTQVVEVQTALDSIEADIAITRTFHDQSLIDTDTPRSTSSNQWEIDDSSGVLILETPATTLPYQNTDRQLVYDANNGDCDPIPQTPLYVHTVYFLHEGNLYKRTIPPGEYSTCGDVDIAQIKSCLPEDSCALQDIHLASNISKFETRYFIEPQNASPDDTIFNTIGSGSLQETPYRGVEITIASTIEVDGKNSTHELTLRDSLIIEE